MCAAAEYKPACGQNTHWKQTTCNSCRHEHLIRLISDSACHTKRILLATKLSPRNTTPPSTRVQFCGRDYSPDQTPSMSVPERWRETVVPTFVVCEDTKLSVAVLRHAYTPTAYVTVKKPGTSSNIPRSDKQDGFRVGWFSGRVSAFLLLLLFVVCCSWWWW